MVRISGRVTHFNEEQLCVVLKDVFPVAIRSGDGMRVKTLCLMSPPLVECNIRGVTQTTRKGCNAESTMCCATM
jgi:hypothetical protein